jgi:two-component sensor histidine kinase
MDTTMPGGTSSIPCWNVGTLPAPQNHIAEAEYGHGSQRSNRQPTVPRHHADDVSHSAANSVTRSQFERIATAATRISVRRSKLLGTLLSAASPAVCGGRLLLRPLWATECLHRAYTLIRLLGRLERRSPSHNEQSGRPDFEARLGAELASIYNSLAINSDEEPRVCSTALRDVARNLIELFGPVVGDINLLTSVDHLVLPAFQHRALVLIASELVMNTLLHAFKGRCSGRVTFEFSVINHGTARLTVTDDGDNPFSRVSHRPARCSVSNYLADLLLSELSYRPATGGGTIAEIDIPLSVQ